MRLHRTGSRTLTVAIALATISALFLPSAAAGDPTITVIASGLANPRGIALRDTGQILVAESGAGGACEQVQGAGEVCFGMTASITRVAPDGQTKAVVRLPSIAGPDGFAAGGASDVVYEGGTFYVVMGGAPPGLPPVFGPNAKWFNDLLTAKPLERITDLGKYEAANNPDGVVVDSNPYAVARVAGGTLVADAGGNDLILVTDAGARELVATFPTQDLVFEGDTIPAEAVPNTVTVGPDGAWYVGQLTGFPFTIGSSRVWRIEPDARDVACDAAATDGPCTLFADGLTAIIDIAFDAEGTLYVLEIAKNGVLALESGDPAPEDLVGALLRMDGDTFTEVASEGLVTPSGLAISADGRIFVTNYGIFPGQGEVVEVVAAP